MSRFTPKLSYSPHKYIPELEGVRGLAILLVVLFHCFRRPLTDLGWIGVDLFFILSGFLITGILIDSKGESRYYTNFIGRRVLRIFPLYYLVLIVMVFLIPIFWRKGSDSNFSFYVQHQDWFWSYLQNWLFSFNGFPKNLILSHFWSLGVEEQFYLFWPWVVFFLPTRYLLKVSISLCIFAIIFRLSPLPWLHFSPDYRYVHTFSRMDALLIGSIIAQLVRENRRLLEKIAIPVGFFGLSVFITGIIINRSLHSGELYMYYTGIDLFMGMILFLSVSNVKWIRDILRFKSLTFLGKYSYGLYVYHVIIFVMLRNKLGAWLTIHLDEFQPIVYVLVLGIITIVLSLIISVMSYHLFEIHFIKLKVYFSKKAQTFYDKGKVMEMSPLLLQKDTI